MEMIQNELAEQKQQDNDISFEDFDIDAMEELLNQDIEESLADLAFLAEEKEKIGNPENLGKVIQDVIWEQFQNQISTTIGEEFIKDNHGKTLDLRKEAHYQTTENFAKGKFATHNTEINYKKRYDDWQSNFQKDGNGKIKTHVTRTGKEVETLVKGARKPFDKGRPTGSKEKGTQMDHTVSAAEIIRDPSMNAHLTKEEQIQFANSNKNLNEMPASWNQSKGGDSTNDWLDNPNANGQKPDEIFDMSGEDKKKLRKKDEEARKEKDKVLEEGEQKSIAAGKKSRKEETFRIGKAAIRAAVTQLLAELVKEIISKLIKWFKSTNKKLKTLLDSLREAIHSFVGKIKTHLISVGDTLFSTVATAIVGPVFGTLKKVWTMLKQGWSSLNNAVNYIKDPANRGKSTGILMMEAGKIIISGITGIGALLLSEVIEKGLLSIPIFAVEIPLLGTLANILGIFFGAVVSGIVGAIAINFIEKRIERSLKRDSLKQTIEKQNELLAMQNLQLAITEQKAEIKKENTLQNIAERHRETNKVTQEILNEIFTPVPESDFNLDFGSDDEFDNDLNNMQADLEFLLGE